MRELTGSIDTALKALAFHVLTQEHLPLVKRIADVSISVSSKPGSRGSTKKGVRGELLYRTADCLNYYTEADPAAIKEIERKLERYERLREKAGVDRQLLEDASGCCPDRWLLSRLCWRHSWAPCLRFSVFSPVQFPTT